MNCNREQFLRAVERGQALLAELKKDYPELKLSPVFSRFGPRSGQCALTTDLKKIVIEFPEMLAGDPRVKKLRELLKAAKQAEKDGEKENASNLRKEVAAISKALLDPKLDLYCGDVLIEFRPGELKYEPLRRLQHDARLPPGLNTVGNIRVVAGSLEIFAERGDL